MTPSSVNVHYHGTNISPTCHSDEVIRTMVNSGETFTYNITFPTDEPPGLYWYHPHIHGISEAAVQGGATGAIIVEGIEKIQPAVANLPQRLLMVRDNPLPGSDDKKGNSSEEEPGLGFVSELCSCPISQVHAQHHSDQGERETILAAGRHCGRHHPRGCSHL